MMPRCGFFGYLFLLPLLLFPCGISLWVPRFPKFELTEPKTINKLTEPEPNTELVVDPSGEVLLRIQESGYPIWSFSTRSPIHSSYQAPRSSAFVLEYADNSEATMVDYHYARLKVDFSMEDLLKKTPLVTEDGVIQGSKTTSAYLVDGMSGMGIRLFKPIHSDNNISAMVESTITEWFVKLPLVITRTDSKAEHFDKTTLKVAWNVTVSHFKAELLCDLALNLGDKLGPKILDGVYMPLRCGSQTDVRALIKSELLMRVPLICEAKPAFPYTLEELENLGS